MKFLLTAFIAVLFTSLVTFSFVHVHLTDRLPWEKEEEGRTTTLKLPSKILSETRDAVIALPRNYSTQKEYPVLYILDGGSAQVHDAVSALEVLAANGYTPETIVVGVPNPSMEARQRDLTPPYMLSDNDDPASVLGSGDKFLEFMEQELIPWVDRVYSTSDYRLVSGNSRGGLIVLHSLMTNPNLFQAHFCYSTPFWRQEEIILQKFNEFITKTDTLNSFLFFSVGEQETANIRKGSNSLAETLTRDTPSGMYWNFQITPAADHQSNSRQSVNKALGLWGKYFHGQMVLK